MVSPSPSETTRSNRRLELGLGVLAVLLLGLLVWGLVTGFKTKSAHNTTTVTHPALTVPAASNPVGSNPSLVPLGKFAAIGSGWRMSVVAVLRHVSQKALGLAHKPLPPGMQNLVVEFTIRYVRAGRGNSQAVVSQMKATIGGVNPVYAAKHGCLGRGSFAVSTGHPGTGNACFVVASNDARNLKLFVYRPGSGHQATTPRSWFALR
jgi:hypothetical protein